MEPLNLYPPEHELFPNCEEEFEYILICRFEPDMKQPNFCRTRFAPDELTSLADIYDRFGAGDYEVQARRSDRRGTVMGGRAKHSFKDGRSKPMNGPAVDPAEQAPVPVMVPQAAPSSGMTTEALLMLMLQMQRESSQQMNAMFMGLLQQGQQQAREHIQSMSALHQQFSQGQTELMGRLFDRASAPPATDPTDLLVKGIEIGQTAVQSDPVDAGGSDIAAIMGAASEALRKLPDPAPPAPPEPQRVLVPVPMPAPPVQVAPVPVAQPQAPRATTRAPTVGMVPELVPGLLGLTT